MARRADHVTGTVSGVDAVLLVAAAGLHDVGYAAAYAIPGSIGWTPWDEVS